MSGFFFGRRQKAALVAMCAPAAGAVFLLAIRVVTTSTFDFNFMIWNLTLSFLAVAASLLCVHFWEQKHRFWTIVLFLIWLFLLPNTFYMLTDLVHLGETADINLLFDIVMLSLFAITGFIQGCLSLWIIHRPLMKRFGRLNSHLLIGLTILASSFAIDMGRFLRWNSWDILLHPQTLLFDLSDTFLNPLNYNRSFLVTGVFFVATLSVYTSFWYGMSLLKSPRE